MRELAERDASGAIAAIYDEIRTLWTIPYVSSLQRHLATRSGWLEWAWAALRPAFASGRAQSAAWRAADGVPVPRIDAIGRDALRVWGVDGGGEAAVRAVCESFVRASPVNLVFSGLLRRLLDGARPDAGPVAVAWTPPPAVPALPPLVDVDALPGPQRGVLLSLATTVDGRPFVPGLYRMLAHWPALMAHLATALGPHVAGAATAAAFRALLDAIDAEVPHVFAMLPAPPATPPAPPASEFAPVRAALDAYRITSPQMIVFGRLIRDALP